MKEVAQIGAAIGRESPIQLLPAVHKPEAELGSSLERIIEAGLLFRQGLPPHATYLFKHALVQDAADGPLLREPEVCFSRIAETLENQFTEIAKINLSCWRVTAPRPAKSEGCGVVGQGGKTVARTSALVEAEQPAKCPRSDCGLASYACAASRANQASGRT